MFKTYSTDVYIGELVEVEKDHQKCLVKNARKVHYWIHACSLSQLAMEGSKDIENCKIAMSINYILLDQVIEIETIPMSLEKIIKDFQRNERRLNQKHSVSYFS
jgi:SepF-like predicted cell division protein (DUF552 family)